VSTEPAPGAAIRALATSAALLARGDDIDATVDTILGGAAAAVGADAAVVFLLDLDRDELALGAWRGMPEAAAAAFGAQVAGDPDHPISRAARDVSPSIGRVGPGPDGAPMTGVDLPLVVARDGIDIALGVASFGWYGDRASAKRPAVARVGCRPDRHGHDSPWRRSSTSARRGSNGSPRATR
jgi:hypothetical protein